MPNPPVMKHYRRHFPDHERQLKAILASSWVYVGNMSFFTRELQIRELFQRAGRVVRIVMGLNWKTKQPCGFCFVELDSCDSAQVAEACLSGLVLDEQVIKVQRDWGWTPGRQFGRASNGGQIRDLYRKGFNPHRGGYGHFEKEGFSDKKKYFRFITGVHEPRKGGPQFPGMSKLTDDDATPAPVAASAAASPAEGNASKRIKLDKE